MVSKALLTIDSVEGNETPNALLSIAGKTIIQRQILQLQRLGVEHFIISVDVMSASILGLADELQRSNISAEFIRNLHTLEDMLSHSDHFIMLSDAIICKDSCLERLISSNENRILILKRDSDNHQYELIDLGHRWTGIAILDGSLVLALKDMPEDSSIQSTLLRLALQNNYSTETIKASDISLQKIMNQQDADKISDRYIIQSIMVDGRRGVLDRYILEPLNHRILHFFWERPKYSKIFQNSPIIIGLFSLLSALLGIEALVYFLAVSCCVLLFFQQRYLRFGYDYQYYKISEALTLFILFLSLGKLHIDANIWVYGVIIFFMLGYIVKYLRFQNNYEYFTLSFLDSLFILMIANIWHLELYAMMLISVYHGFWVMVCIAVNAEHHIDDIDKHLQP